MIGICKWLSIELIHFEKSIVFCVFKGKGKKG